MRTKGVRKPVAGNLGRLGESTLCNSTMALVKRQNPSVREVPQLSRKRAQRPTERKPERKD